MSALDREKAHEVLFGRLVNGNPYEMRAVLDALAGCVTDEPPTIDRGELMMLLAQRSFKREMTYGQRADQILALLRPDSRIAKLEALCEDYELDGDGLIGAYEVRAIIRGEA